MATDIIFGSDLEIANGDFVVGPSDKQHVEHLLLSFPGAYKNASLLGIGAAGYLLSPSTAIARKEFERNAKIQLEADGATNVKVKVWQDFTISIMAEYGSI